MSNRDWFISPLSRPGFGILNNNSHSQQPIPQPLGPEQAIYLNNLQYREPHTNVAAHDSSLIAMPAPETLPAQVEQSKWTTCTASQIYLMTEIICLSIIKMNTLRIPLTCTM
ncbi:hypothetical protein O181_034222 [Austropuccinia psidii MF-1]|uniref:Uncharacterized protein n=1 Tax=Austropuccinia psidii MF-1 TaxID=1389203 RepID=A0A9Q3D665_9BASI|nr:hypothetical protein [Austropuccinia psidii MF-1]